MKNQFAEMIKEAFVGEEPYDPSPGRKILEASLRKFERRDRAVRVLSWFTVTFMGVVFVWAAWSFWKTGEDTSTKMLLVYALAMSFAMLGIGWGKMFLFNTQLSLSLLKELKRLQLMTAESLDRPSP